MKVTIESTSKLVEVNGVPARIWEGKTESGIAVHCYITRVAVEPGENEAQFKAELMECRAPSEAIEAIPLRLIL
jgi:hypothetical protein